MTRRLEWTESEVNRLKETYASHTAHELRDIFPNRSVKAIHNKARRLGLYKDEETIRRTGEQSQSIGYREEYPEITEGLLREMYEVERMSAKDIGDHFGCSQQVILKRLRRFNIETRKCPSEYFPEERKAKWGRPGAQHPNWKGGITEISNIIRNRVSHVSLEAFKRDGFSCVECGGGEHELNAHHIRPFSEIVAEIREENDLHDLSTWEAKNKLADICEKDDRLLDLDNLITLCEECHYLAHHGDKIDEKEAIA